MPAPETGAERRRRRGRRRRILIAILALVAAAYALREPLFGRALGALAAHRLSRALGCPVAIERIGGTWFTSLRVDGLVVGEPGVGALRSARCDELEATYAPWRLAHPLAALRSLRTRGAVLAIAPSAAAHEGSARPPPTLRALLARVPRPLPRLDLRVALRVATPYGAIAAREAHLASDGDEDAARLVVTEVVADRALAPLCAQRWRFAIAVARDRVAIASDDAIAGVVPRSLALVADGAGVDEHVALDLEVAGGRLAGEIARRRVDLALSAFSWSRVPAWARAAATWRLPLAGTSDARVIAWRLGDAPWAASGEAHARALAWPELTLDRVDADGRWDGGRLALASARIAGSGVDAAVDDLVWDPRAPLRLDRLGRLEATAADLGVLARRFAPAVGARLPTAPIALDARAAQDASGRLTLERLRVDCADAHLAASGSVGLPPDLARWRRSALALRAELSAPSLAALVAGTAGSLALRANLDGTPAEPSGDFAATGRGLVARGLALGDLDVAASARWPRVRLRALSLAGAAARVAAAGEADIAAWRVDDATASVQAPDLAALATRFAPDVSLAGEASLDATWSGPLPRTARDLAAAAGAQGALRASGSRLTIGGRALGTASARATLADGRLLVERVALDGAFGVVDLGGAAAFADDGVAIELERFAWRAGHAAIRLEPPLRARIDGRGFALENAAFAVGDGRLEVAALIGERWDARIALADVSPGPWLARVAARPRIDGRLSAVLRVAGDPAAPDASCRVSAPGLRIDGRPAALELDAHQDAAGAIAPRLAVRWGDARLDASGSWPLRVGRRGIAWGGSVAPRLDASAVAPHLADLDRALPVAGACALEAHVAADDGGAPRARLGVEAKWLRPRVDPTARGVEVARLVDATFAATADGDAIAAELALRADDARVATLTAQLAAPGWPARPAALGEAALTGRLVLDRFPLDRAQPWTPGLVRLAGAAGGDLALGGTARAPTLHGAVALTGVALRLRAPLGPIADGEGVARIAADRVVLERFACRMGGEPAAITGSLVRAADGAQIDAHLTGERALLVQTQDLRLRGDLDLALTGPLAAPLLAGHVDVTDALYSRDLQLIGGGRGGGGARDDRFQLFSLRDAPWSRMRFAVKIAAPRTVRIENNLFRGQLSVDLALGGTGETPSPVGLVSARDARVKLPFSTLALESAQLRFLDEDPFRPRMDATGTSSFANKDPTQLGRRITLTVHVSGPYSDLQIVTASDPPMDEDDRMSLLTTGYTRSALTADPTRSGLGLAGSYLFSEFKSWAAGPGDPDAGPGFLDRFDVSLGQTLSYSGQETFRGEMRLDATEPGNWFLIGERDRWDDVDLDVVFRLRFR